MNHDDYNAVVRPKVLGSWNLHHQSLSLDLDFFILLSSLTGIVGNTSQCNYAAGNTFEDALARHRTSLALPALSIDLGAVNSVGYVSETAGVAERLKRTGTAILEEEELLRLIERGIMIPRQADVDACPLITGIPAGAGNTLDSTATFWENPIFSALKTAREASAVDGARSEKGAGLDLEARLREARSGSEATDLVAAAIVKKLADMFAIAEDSIEAERPLAWFGVDSLVAVELRNWLKSRARAEASIFDVTQSQSITALAGKVVGKSGLVRRELRGEGR